MIQFLKCDSYLPPYMAYPKFLMKVDISETAKLVYMLLLDRARLSMKNKDWQGAYWDTATLSALAEETYQTTVSVARIEFPEGTTGIRGSSFKGNTELVYIKVASTITKLHGNSFQNCSNLATIIAFWHIYFLYR